MNWWQRWQQHRRYKRAHIAVIAGPKAIAKFLESSRFQRLKQVRKDLRKLRP